MNIAISGKMAAGKTTASEYLVNQYGYKRVSLAGVLKEFEAIHCSTPPEQWRDAIAPIANKIAKALNDELYIHKYFFAEEIIEGVIEVFNKHEITTGKNRALLQELGTDYGRNKLHQDVWCLYFVKYSIPENQNVVVDDLRFKNELDVLSQNGFITLRLEILPETQKERLQSLYSANSFTEERLTHPSETDLDDYLRYFDYVYDTGEFNKLYPFLDFINFGGWR